MSDVTAVMNLAEEEPRLELPPGFRFHPTDEEVVSHYLTPKVIDCSFSCLVIADVDLNKCEPWDLPGKLITKYTFSIYSRLIERQCMRASTS